ncbi:hypothetical protein NL532_10180 [Mesorhizobium sp. C120A]|uniref:hypothetical protein n=1 Tax=unclassified Mesorhizobium TaxID=325217 RepID=UPI0003CFCA7D|nr:MULTISPECIES: hypothetical protein [unclassified Mesorhizobium]ESZ66634.1 hypothetical protein X728_04030 [Mesorhizobium sp. L103C120A0]WJI46962.1 hypothetical protein NL532_10180 [Mesorhizobium sp. C120A]
MQFDLTAYDGMVNSGLTKWLKEKIALSPEYAAATGGKVPAIATAAKPVSEDAPFDDEIAF